MKIAKWIVIGIGLGLVGLVVASVIQVIASKRDQA